MFAGLIHCTERRESHLPDTNSGLLTELNRCFRAKNLAGVAAPKMHVAISLKPTIKGESNDQHGTGGDEAIHSILDVMYARAPYTTIQRAVHIHPTVPELIPTMLGELEPLSEK